MQGRVGGMSGEVEGSVDGDQGRVEGHRVEAASGKIWEDGKLVRDGGWEHGTWVGGQWWGSELKVLTALAATEGLSATWLRADLKAVAAGTGRPKAISTRINHLIGFLARRGLISRTQTHITILDYEGLRKELGRGKSNLEGGDEHEEDSRGVDGGAAVPGRMLNAGDGSDCSDSRDVGDA
jgi:hypothetical protein